MKPLESSRLNAKNRVQAGEENFAAERSNKRKEILSLSRAESISFTIRNKTVTVLYPAR